MDDDVHRFTTQCGDQCCCVGDQFTHSIGEASARTKLGLPGRQEQLVRRVLRTGTPTAVVVVSGHRDFAFPELLTAKRALDAGAALIATSRDPTMPMPGGEWPGTGSILAAVETASGRRAEIAGKPERHLFEMALAAADGAARVAMVGDRVSSDIAGGRDAGLATVLVLSGTTDAEAAAAAEPRPDHVVADLAALLR